MDKGSSGRSLARSRSCLALRNRILDATAGTDARTASTLLPEQTPEPRAHFQAGHHLARSPVTIKSVLAHKARSCNGTCFQNCGWPRCSVWPCLHDRNASEARSFRMYRLHVPVSQRNLSWAWAQDVRGTTSKTAHTQTPKMTRIAAVLTHRQLVRASPA